MTIQEIQDQISPHTKLDSKDKFRNAIDGLINDGLSIKVICQERFYCFKSKSGKQYRMKVFVGNKGVLMCKTSISDETHISKKMYNESPQQYKLLGKSESSFTVSKSGVKTPAMIVEYDKNAEISWASLAQAISKLAKDQVTVIDQCYRCDGSGKLVQFAHVHGGICFKCCGTGGSIELIN